MRMIVLALLLSQCFFLHSVAQDDAWKDIPLVKVSDVKFPPSVLEGKWKVSDGVRIDDVSKAKGNRPGERELLAGLGQNGPKGLRSVADYSLASDGFPLDMVTVRVFIFDEPSQCEEWWKKKYEVEGWEKFYEKLDCKNVVAVKSLELPKIAVAFGRVWITSHHIQKGDEHIAAAKYIIEQLSKEEKSLTTTKE